MKMCTASQDSGDLGIEKTLGVLNMPWTYKNAKTLMNVESGDIGSWQSSLPLVTYLLWNVFKGIIVILMHITQ